MVQPIFRREDYRNWEKGYKTVGIRFAYPPDIRNENIFAYDDVKFFETLPDYLKDFCKPMVDYDRKALVNEYFETFEYLYKKYNLSTTCTGFQDLIWQTYPRSVHLMF